MFKKILEDEAGNPSSKRMAAFIVLIHTLVMLTVRGEWSYEVFVTLMVFVTSALGISSLEKIKNKKTGQ